MPFCTVLDRYCKEMDDLGIYKIENPTCCVPDFNSCGQNYTPF